MKPQFIEISTKSDWDKYITFFPEANFLQSWEWGVFHEALGKKVVRLGAFTDSSVVALYQLVVERAKRGSYLTIAGGPLLNWYDSELRKAVIQHLKEVAKQEGVSFVRFRPQQISAPDISNALVNEGCIQAPMHLTADLTLQLNLEQSEEQILQQMRKNTRYDVKKAEKLGITTTITSDPESIQKFYDIQCEVAKRHNFVPFSYKFFYEQFKSFADTGNVVLISSYVDNTLLASAFIIFYNKEAVYHYGISTEANLKLPGSYACQWQAIKEAKSRGCTRYNFWGIAPHDQPTHRFAGVSLFKRGFGGTEVEYMPAQDIPVTSLYWVTHLFERIRKWRRKL